MTGIVFMTNDLTLQFTELLPDKKIFDQIPVVYFTGSMTGF